MNPNNAWDLCITAAAGTELAVPSSSGTINYPGISRADLLPDDRGYDPKAFIPHAASLHQAFAHCERFSTAATRRCLDRVCSSVADRPLRPATRLSLGGPLPHQLADRPRAHPEAPGLTIPSFELLQMPAKDHIRY